MATRLTTDARNRALRTFLQGLGYAVLAAVVMVLLPVFTTAKAWTDFDWSVIGFALAQGVGMSVLSYFMRKVLDPSAVPTPLPPGDPGEPDDDAKPHPEAVQPPEAGTASLVTIVIVVVAVLLLAWLLQAVL